MLQKYYRNIKFELQAKKVLTNFNKSKILNVEKITKEKIGGLYKWLVVI